MPNYLRSDERGLTLIEVLVAMLIIGVALIPVMSMFTSGLFTYTRAGADTLAINLAHSVMEETVALPYGQVVSRAAADYPGYPYRFEVVVTDYNVTKRLKQVLVAVWPVEDPAKRTEVVTLVGGY